jgi:hypothetical protein
VHLGFHVAPTGPREGGAVGGEPGRADGDLVGGDAPGTAAVERCEPHVVLCHEGDEVAVQVRMAEVGVVHGGHVSRDHRQRHASRERRPSERPIGAVFSAPAPRSGDIDCTNGTFARARSPGVLTGSRIGRMVAT